MFRRCVQCWVCFLIAGQLQGTAEGSAVGNMLYGMQGMSSDVAEVRSVLDVFLDC
jgi:hypothetical protein